MALVTLMGKSYGLSQVVHVAPTSGAGGSGLAAASALGAASAQAEVLAFTILDYPGFGGAPTVYETFDLDSSAGRQDLVPRTVYFAISNDSLGRTGAYFGGPITGNAFGTGKLQNGGVLPINFAIFLSSKIYDGSGLALDAAPGDTFYSRYFKPDRLGGYEILVAGVPEASTWAMMALGFAGLGFMGYQVRRKALAA